MKIILLIIALLVLICLIILIYLLISPVWLIIDSKENKYWFGWNRWLNARFTEESKTWGVRISLPFWTKRFELKDMVFSEKGSMKRIRSTVKQSRNGRKMWKMLKQIRIKDLRLVLDTRDVILNAYLYPVFELMRIGSQKLIRINFTGQNEICLKANFRMINLLKAGFL